MRVINRAIRKNVASDPKILIKIVPTGSSPQVMGSRIMAVTIVVKTVTSWLR
jgi:hypothetical protein